MSRPPAGRFRSVADNWKSSAVDSW